MVATFIIRDADGIHTYTGRVVCRTPSTIVIVQTEPSSLAGRSVQFDSDAVIDEKVVAGS